MQVTTNTRADSATNSTTTIPQRQLNEELDKNAFLSLLVTQMQNQDPMKPMENTEFIAQLAQFSSLEQMQQVSQKMDSVAASANLTNVSTLLGHTVTVLDSTTGEETTGAVSSITFADGLPKLVINEKSYDPSLVLRVDK